MDKVREIHIVCNKIKNGGPLNVRDVSDQYFVSGFWRVNNDHLRHGVIFALHKTQKSPSFLQGVIEDAEKIKKGGRVEIRVRRTPTPLICLGPWVREKAYVRGSLKDRPISDFARVFVPKDISRGEFRRNVAVRTMRDGQPQFRNELLVAYGKMCAVTSCDVEPVLEAAHIVPYDGRVSQHVQNGLLLRSDIHALFDRQMVWFEPFSGGVRVRISKRLVGTDYEAFDGQGVRLPSKFDHAPSRAQLNRRLELMPIVSATAVARQN